MTPSSAWSWCPERFPHRLPLQPEMTTCVSSSHVEPFHTTATGQVEPRLVQIICVSPHHSDRPCLPRSCRPRSRPVMPYLARSHRSDYPSYHDPSCVPPSRTATTSSSSPVRSQSLRFQPFPTAATRQSRSGLAAPRQIIPYRSDGLCPNKSCSFWPACSDGLGRACTTLAPLGLVVPGRLPTLSPNILARSGLRRLPDLRRTYPAHS